MSTEVAVGYDCIAANVGKLPAGAAVVAGYSTGSGDVPWTAADWAKYPAALRYCQDAGATDATADVLDVESGAATVADCPGWAKRAQASYDAVTRPGQRKPAIYCAASNVTPVANSLVAGGVKSGVGLVIANWNLSQATAGTDVAAGSGPFPVVGVQFSDPGPYDMDVYSKDWVDTVSAKVPAGNGPAKCGTGWRWVADGTKSLEQFAATRGASVLGLLQISAANLNAGNYAALNAYIEGGVSVAMPRGLVYYTANA